MNIRNAVPGQVVKLNTLQSPLMSVVSVYPAQNSVDCRYWNAVKGRFEDIALIAEMLTKEHESIIDRVRDIPTFSIGDRVEFIGECPIEMVVSDHDSTMHETKYTCGFHNPITGSIESEEFYGFELKKAGEPWQFSI
jgi:hypothetical protein